MARTTLLSLLLCQNAIGLSVSAFSVGHIAPTTVALRQSASSSSRLNLLPTQASELVERAYPPQNSRDDEDDEIGTTTAAVSESENQGVVCDKKLSFVKRVFSIPSSIIDRHPHPHREGFPDGAFAADKKNNDKGAHYDSFFDASLSSSAVVDKNKHDDVVLYPVVGCRLVDGRALPSMTSNRPSCRIFPAAARDEEVYGWYASKPVPVAPATPTSGSKAETVEAESLL